MSNYNGTYTPFEYDVSTDVCCKPQTPPGGGDCGCLDTWVLEYREKSGAYKLKVAEEGQKKEELTRAIEWRDKLKKCYDSLQATHEKAENVSSQVEVFADLLSKVCVNTGKMVDVIEMLFCMVRNLYGCVDMLKDNYDELKRRIECIKDPGLKQGEGILKCLEEYGKRLQEVIDTANGLIKNIIKALKAANILDEYICCEYGVSVNLKKVKSLFNHQGDATAAGKQTGAFDIKASPFPCDTGKLDQPVKFPLNTDKFYTDTKTQLDEANTRLDGPGGLRKRYEDIAKEKNLLQACANSLEKAIKEWQDAKNCK